MSCMNQNERIRKLESTVERLVANIQGLEEQNHALEKQNHALEKQNLVLANRVKELEVRLNKNSGNSSKPPSSDAPWDKQRKKKDSLRNKSGKRPGGQTGHRGTNLNRVKNPDHIEVHPVNFCEDCEYDLTDVENQNYEKRQVVDIPKPKIEVTEHRAEKKRCPCCGHMTKASFPSGVNSPIQYGPRIKSFACYLHFQHLIPYDRLGQLTKDLFGAAVSEGSFVTWGKRLASHLSSFQEQLKEALLQEEVLHADETGINVGRKLHWLHTLCSSGLTYYTIHKKRGKEAMDAADILPRYGGILVHDAWSPYFRYEMDHALCNAHHLRELNGLVEQETWAKEMFNHLLAAKRSDEITSIEEQYDAILLSGFSYHNNQPPLDTNNKRGRKKQRPGKNLLDRLSKWKVFTLRFLHDTRVPFTNNLAEQAVRMAKLKQKISGCFRTFKGAEEFCLIRSYLATCRKQGWCIIEAIKLAVGGNPMNLKMTTS